MSKNPNPIDYFKDESDGGFSITTVQDAEPILEENKRAYNNWGAKKTFGKHGDGTTVASIPIVLWREWVKENPMIAKPQTPEGRKLLAAKLADPQFKYLLRAPVRI